MGYVASGFWKELTIGRMLLTRPLHRYPGVHRAVIFVLAITVVSFATMSPIICVCYCSAISTSGDFKWSRLSIDGDLHAFGWGHTTENSHCVIDSDDNTWTVRKSILSVYGGMNYTMPGIKRRASSIYCSISSCGDNLIKFA